MGKQKKMVSFIRIEVHYLILPNIVTSVYNTQKIQNGFSNF